MTEDDLRRIERAIERHAYNFVGQGIGESDSPEVIRRLPVAASGGKAADPANGMAQCKPRSKGVAGTQGGHVVLAHEPCRHGKGRYQTSREHASCLQGFEGENLAQVLTVNVPTVPIQDDVKDLCAQNAREDDSDAKVPGIFRFEALPLRVPDADPKTYENANRDQNPVSGDAKRADLKKAREHLFR